MSTPSSASSTQSEIPEVVSLRRDLHQIPELDHDLPKTRAYLREKLAAWGCQILQPTPTSLAVFFDFGRENALAFRADMDALPISEAVDVPWRSRHEGQMHACGHDAHMAMLLSLCSYLQDAIDRQEALPHNYLAIFQPAEETTGGAKEICETGIFQQYRVKYVFGVHMWPGLPAGELHARPGGQMARSGEITVRVHGQSCHIAEASQGKDALVAAALIASRSLELERTAYDLQTLRLLRFGILQAGTAQNVLAGEALLRGALRAFSDEVFETLRAGLAQICREVEQETGCSVNLHVSEGFPPVINDPELFAKVQAFDPTSRLHLLAEPQMTAEDFSFYQLQVPGVFFFLGTGKKTSLHSPDFDLDESTLPGGVEFLQALTNLE